MGRDPEHLQASSARRARRSSAETQRGRAVRARRAATGQTDTPAEDTAAQAVAEPATGPAKAARGSVLIVEDGAAHAELETRSLLGAPEAQVKVEQLSPS